ncbi:MAG: hypothetical protein ACLFN6_03915, partial [Desulfonatronovibrio sp.]
RPWKFWKKTRKKNWMNWKLPCLFSDLLFIPCHKKQENYNHRDTECTEVKKDCIMIYSSL